MRNRKKTIMLRTHAILSRSRRLPRASRDTAEAQAGGHGDGDIVRIGDLSTSRRAGRTPIFRAPDLGQTGVVLTGKIMDALPRMAWRARHARDSRSRGHALEPHHRGEDIEARVARALARATRSAT